MLFTVTENNKEVGEVELYSFPVKNEVRYLSLYGGNYQVEVRWAYLIENENGYQPAIEVKKTGWLSSVGRTSSFDEPNGNSDVSKSDYYMRNWGKLKSLATPQGNRPNFAYHLMLAALEDRLDVYLGESKVSYVSGTLGEQVDVRFTLYNEDESVSKVDILGIYGAYIEEVSGTTDLYLRLQSRAGDYNVTIKDGNTYKAY